MTSVPATHPGPARSGHRGLLPDRIIHTVHRTAGLALVAVAALPFALGALLWRVTAEGGVRGPSLSNHFLIDALGVPDPTCGATRAFILFVHGDARFVDYNPVWVVAALALGGLGIVMAVRRALGLPLLGGVTGPALLWLNREASHLVLVLLPLVAAGWVMAFLHLSAIRHT